MTLAQARARVLLAEDHSALLAQEVRLLCGAHDIVGTAADGIELLKAAARLKPDVIVMDVSMPGMGGLDAARELRAARCGSRLVFVSVWDDADYVRDAMDLDASGYVLKARLASDLAPAVSAALAGETFVSHLENG